MLKPKVKLKRKTPEAVMEGVVRRVLASLDPDDENRRRRIEAIEAEFRVTRN